MLQEVMHRLEHIVFTPHDTLEFVCAIQFQFMVRSVFWRWHSFPVHWAGGGCWGLCSCPLKVWDCSSHGAMKEVEPIKQILAQDNLVRGRGTASQWLGTVSWSELPYGRISYYRARLPHAATRRGHQKLNRWNPFISDFQLPDLWAK